MLFWVPGHSGIKGNEKAHELAKKATGKRSPQPPQRDGMPWYLMRLALKRADIKAELGRPTKETGKFTRKIDAALHLGKSAKMYQQLNSTEAAILTQLRTSKSFLKEYLYKIKASETAMCDCGSTESVTHFLFSCSRWTHQRIKMKQKHGRRFGDLSYALGGYLSRQEGGRNINGPIEYWELDINVVRATIQFTKSTGHLQAKNQEADTDTEADLIEREQLQIPSPTTSLLRSHVLGVARLARTLKSHSPVLLSGNASVIGRWDAIALSEGQLVVGAWRRCIAMSEGRCKPWVAFPYKVVRRWYVPGTPGTGI